MIKLFTDAWAASHARMKEYVRAFINDNTTVRGNYRYTNASVSYEQVLVGALKAMFPPRYEEDTEQRGVPCHARVTAAAGAGHSANVVLVVGEGGYSCCNYWITVVEYGSCAGCDALEAAFSYKDVEKAEGALMRVILTMVQNMRQVHSPLACEEEK